MRSRPGSRGKPHLQPCIAELLRTCIHPPGILLRVERILEVQVLKEDIEGMKPEHEDFFEERGSDYGLFTYRLYLGDGDLMIQALLRPELQALISMKEIIEGTIIDLRKFNVRKAKRVKSEGRIVYLAIDDLVCVSQPTSDKVQDNVLLTGGGFLPEYNTINPEKLEPAPKHERIQALGATSTIAQESDEMPSSQESDAFETGSINMDLLRKRRRVLHDLHNSVRLKRQRTDNDEDGHASNKRQRTSNASNPPITAEPIKQMSSLQKAGFDEQSLLPPEYPTHTLLSLLRPLTPLPAKNYTLTILAVITHVSTNIIHRQSSPFPPKRHIKLSDPSTSKTVTLAVYVDARNFLPKVGTLALFRGVTMQKWEGEIILNKYWRSRPEGPWFMDDERELEDLGYDVRAMREWWDKRRTAVR